jgi:general secretion pathway protein A
MYESFFGLKQAPFSIAPDPRYLFMSERHREALAHLLYGLGGGGGFVLLTGEVGAGKTTVCRCFLEQVPAECTVAYIFNPRLSVLELLQSVCQEFGIAVPAGADGQPPSIKGHIDPLNAFLLQAHAQGRHCVLVIDEAQNLASDVLEQLRLLTNLETVERKLLQIILIGQPELRSQLAQPALEQLAQRVIARYHLGALTAPETAAYIAHRLAVAGHHGALPFDAAALRRTHRLTAGVPRRINLLCDRALLGAYAQGRAQVGARVVERAASEVFGGEGPRRGAQSPALAWGLGGLLAGVVVAGLGWAAWRAGGGPGAAAALAGPPASSSSATGVAARPPSAPDASPAATAASASASASAAMAATAGSAAAVATATTAAAAQASTAVAASGAATARLAASGTAPPRAAAAPLPRFDAARDLAALPADEQAAWAALAPAFGLVASPAPLCGHAAPWQCFRTGQASLGLLRTLDRPGLLLLRDAAGGPPRWAVLAGLTATDVVLAAEGRRWRLPLDELAALWRGDFTTLWQSPAGYQRPLAAGATGAATDALAQGLARLRGEPLPAPGQALAGALATRLAGFQLAQGLKPDGVAGPTTFMQLNRALAVAEPRLPQGN